MFNIGGLFAKFVKLQADEIGLRTLVSESLKINTGINIDIKEIEIKNNTIFIKNLPQAGKNVLFIKKTSILEDINSKFPSKKILNIKY